MTEENRRIVFTADSRFAVTDKTADKPVTLKGYPLTWNTLSSDRGGFKVRLRPGSATFLQPTHALFSHSFSDILGDTESGTLRILPADDFGIPIEVDLPDTTLGRDVHELVRTKRLRGMSFSMVGKPRGKTIKENGQEIFDAEAYQVDEVSLVANPSFVTATVDLKRADFAARTAHALRVERFKLDLCALPAPLPRHSV